MSGDAYDGVAAGYDAGYAGAYWEVYDHVTLATAGPYLPDKGGRVLDAGAGTGKFALRLLERGCRVTLLDPSPAMLEQARAKVEAAGFADRAEYVVGGIESMRFEDGAFDAVFCEGDPLSYCRESYRIAVGEILRVLRPGGGFYVSCDSRWFTTVLHLCAGDPAGALAVADTGDARDRYGIPVRAFTPDELSAAFREAGGRDVAVLGKVVLLGYMGADALAKALQEPDARRRLLEMELRASRDPSLAGIGGHLQVVGRR